MYDEDTTALDAKQSGYDAYDPQVMCWDVCPYKFIDLRNAYYDGWLEAQTDSEEDET